MDALNWKAVKTSNMPEGVSFNPETGILQNCATPKVPRRIILKLDGQGGISVGGKGVAPSYIKSGGKVDFSCYGEYGKNYIIEWV